MQLNLLANGPSLANFELSEFKPSTSIGMNSAFRYWQTIDWVPEIYVSADPVVTKQNVLQISELLETNRVRTAVVNKVYLDQFPWTPHIQLPLKSQVMIGTEKQADFEVFKGRWTTFSTTGSIAIRLAAALGGTEINLFGFDLSYLDWRQRRKAPFSLARERTSGESKDYFFPEYQGPGDLFQTPNPRFLPFDLHKTAVVNSIRVARDLYPGIKFRQYGSESLALYMDGGAAS